MSVVLLQQNVTQGTEWDLPHQSSIAPRFFNCTRCAERAWQSVERRTLRDSVFVIEKRSRNCAPPHRAGVTDRPDRPMDLVVSRVLKKGQVPRPRRPVRAPTHTHTHIEPQQVI